LVTFFYYKPPLILESLRDSIKMDMSGYPLFAIGLLVAAPANLLVYFCSPAGQPTANTRWVAGLTLLYTLHSASNTAADLFFFCIFGAGLALGIAVAAGTRLALQRMSYIAASRSARSLVRNARVISG
jgi:hypothetical protein